MQVITEKIITVNEAHALLKERQKQGNLSYEQQNTLNYFEDLLKIDDKDAAKMVKELMDAGLTQWQAVKVTDLLPKKEEELKAILAGSGAIDASKLKSAFEIVKSYRKDSKEPAKTRKIEPTKQEAAPEGEQTAAAKQEADSNDGEPTAKEGE
ncbi:MAG: hypothetical protein V1722_02660 [Candidatus Micrarchaeota archaeon]